MLHLLSATTELFFTTLPFQTWLFQLYGQIVAPFPQPLHLNPRPVHWLWHSYIPATRLPKLHYPPPELYHPPIVTESAIAIPDTTLQITAHPSVPRQLPDCKGLSHQFLA